MDRDRRARVRHRRLRRPEHPRRKRPPLAARPTREPRRRTDLRRPPSPRAMTPERSTHTFRVSRARVRARRAAVTLAALLVAGELAGCAGIANPYQTNGTATRTTSTPRTTTPADAGDPTPERNGTVPPRQQAAIDRLSAGAARTSPQVALTRYAPLYINWTAAQRRGRPAAARRDLTRASPSAGAPSRRQPRPRSRAHQQRGLEHGHRRRDHRRARRRRRTLGARHPRADHRAGRLRRPAADPARHLRPTDRHRKRLGRHPMAAPELTRSSDVAGRGFPSSSPPKRGVAALISGRWACAGSRSRRQRHSVRPRQWPGPPSGPQPVRTRHSTPR